MKKIIGNTAWLIGAEILNKASNIIVTIIIARVYGNESFGQFSTAFSFIMIFSVLADFGINNLVIREIARKKEDATRFIGNSLLLKIPLSLFTLVAIVAVTILTNQPQPVRIFIYLLAFYTVFNSYNTLAKAIFRSFERMKYETFLKLFESLLLIMIVATFAFLHVTPYAIAATYAVLALLTFALSLHWTRKHFFSVRMQWDSLTVTYLLKHAWLFGLASVFVMLYFQVDTVMVNKIRGDYETSLYSAAYNIILGLALFPSLLHATLYPLFSRKYGGKLSDLGPNVKRYVPTLFGAGVVIAIILYYAAPWLISFLYGEDYSEAVGALQIIAFLLPFLFFCNFMGTVFSAINKQVLNTWVTGLSIVINIVLNSVLIPQYGFIGASVASLISIIAMSIMIAMALLIYNKRYVH